MFNSIGSVLLTIFAIGVLIFIHELGHYGMGRLLNFPIKEFAIGFGPKILKKERNGILYSIRALPFGGFVAYDAEVEEDTGYLTFDRQKLWKRFLVIIAGPLANLILAFLLAVGLIMAIGVTTNITLVGGVVDGSPAFDAGLQIDDEIYSVDGVLIDGDVELLTQMLADSGESIDLGIKRSDEIFEVECVPYFDEQYNKPRIGISLQYVRENRPFFQSVGYAAEEVYISSKFLAGFFVALITRGEGASEVSGVVGAVAVMSDTLQESSFMDFLGMVMFLSVNLCVFNLIPWPGLDGSKILFMGVELIIRHPIKAEKQGVIQLVGFAVIAVLSIILTYRDIVGIVTG